jgi:hypothetical protein
MNLKRLGTQKITLKIPNRPWSESHGVYSGSIGASALYLGLFFASESKNVLIIGSGGGFVPELFLRNIPEDSQITLVDAKLPDSGSGSPFDYQNNFQPTGFKSRNFEYIQSLSEDFLEYCKLEEIYYGFIFIDGDHSESGFTKDLRSSLEIVTKNGLILFHDSKQKSISKVANQILDNWVQLSVGTGVGIYVSTSGKEKTNIANTYVNEETLKSLLKSSYANRWNYLATETFKDRFKEYLNYIEEFIDMSKIQKIMEIGGNPSPIIVELMNKYPRLSFSSVEPYISPIAEKAYEVARNRGLRISTSISTEISQDLIFFLGIDLSVCETFEKFRSDILKLRQNFLNASFVILECPDYEPSNWLIQIFAEDLDQVSSCDFSFKDVSGVSLDGFTLNRHLYIYKKKFNISKNLTERQVELIQKYALFFNMSGTPIPEVNLTDNLNGDTYQTAKNFNCWPVERNTNSGQIFTWLRPLQVINFPHGAKTLKFDLYSEHESRKYRSMGFSVEVYPRELVIRKSIFSHFFNRLKLEYFVPKILDKESTDIRQLSFAVTGYRFE